MIERAITLEQFKKWFSVDFLKQLRQLLLCGNYGDPMTAPELIPILRYFREINPYASISITRIQVEEIKSFGKIYLMLLVVLAA